LKGRVAVLTVSSSGLGKAIALGLAQPREIADHVVFLASERAGYITGAVIQVDGSRRCCSPIQKYKAPTNRGYGYAGL